MSIITNGTTVNTKLKTYQFKLGERLTSNSQGLKSSSISISKPNNSKQSRGWDIYDRLSIAIRYWTESNVLVIRSSIRAINTEIKKNNHVLEKTKPKMDCYAMNNATYSECQQLHFKKVWQIFSLLKFLIKLNKVLKNISISKLVVPSNFPTPDTSSYIHFLQYSTIKIKRTNGKYQSHLHQAYAIALQETTYGQHHLSLLARF